VVERPEARVPTVTPADREAVGRSVRPSSLTSSSRPVPS